MSTTITQDRHAEVVDAIVGLAPDGVAYVPSASIAPIINGVLAAQDNGDLPLVYPVSREEEAIGVVGAYPFAGKFGVIIMQDNGFGNALTALTTFAVSYHLPLLIVANTRGGLGEYNSMIHSISAARPGPAGRHEHPCVPGGPPEHRRGLGRYRCRGRQPRPHDLPTRRGPHGILRSQRRKGKSMKRIEALRAIVESTADVPVVATCAATSRELAAVEDRDNHLYLLDAMGLAISVGTGIAQAIKDTPVTRAVVIEGDGSLLMNPGSAITAGYLAPENLVIVLLDNGVYASTASIPTQAVTHRPGPLRRVRGPEGPPR